MGDETPLNLAILATATGARLIVSTPEGRVQAVLTLDRAAARIASEALADAAGDGFSRTFTPEKARG